MVQAQIEITDEQAEELSQRAAAEGQPMAALVRQAIDRWLEAERAQRRERYLQAATLIGAFEDPSGARDLSVEHDRYLTEHEPRQPYTAK
jgi:Ribbon-helix-helix protein, copG family